MTSLFIHVDPHTGASKQCKPKPPIHGFPESIHELPNHIELTLKLVTTSCGPRQPLLVVVDIVDYRKSLSEDFMSGDVKLSLNSESLYHIGVSEKLPALSTKTEGEITWWVALEAIKEHFTWQSFPPLSPNFIVADTHAARLSTLRESLGKE